MSRRPNHRRAAVRLLPLALALAWAAPAAAGSLEGDITLASDYLFDGISQTDDGFATQGSLTFTADSGFYIGTWASNVDFGEGDPASAEVDFYAGYARSYDSGWGWDVGAAMYTYVGAPTTYDYVEATAAVDFPFGSRVQVWASDDEVFGGSAWRATASHSFALPSDFSIDAQVTRTEYDNELDWTAYWHYQLGVSKAFGDFTAYVGYSDTDLDDNPRADGRVLATLTYSHTFF
jgi:uncharacterized protein (TIGR02001 family)